MAAGEENRPGDSRPTPDPTILTQQAVDRAIRNYREVMEARLGGMDRATELLALSISETRASANDKVLTLQTDFGQRMGNQREILEAGTKNVSDVAGERFAAIATQFAERDTRAGQAEIERQKSLDAALAAAKEAVSEQNKANTEKIGKSELATQKQIDSLVALLTTNYTALNDKVLDVKARLDRGEGTVQGQVQQKVETRAGATDSRQLIGVIVGVSAGLVGIISLILSLVLN